MSNLFVIARNSSFAYKRKSISVKQIAQELGVRYILEGSVLKVGNRVRITAQLIDATTDYHLWSESYDRELTDIFALQDEITMKLISVMHVKLTFGEQARQWEGVTSNIKAYDNWARGLECLLHRTEQSVSQARIFAEEAIVLDPMYAHAYVLLALTHLIDLIWGWSKSPLSSFERVEKLSQKALELNEFLGHAHSLLGIIYVFKRQYDEAIKEGEKAVSLSPNGADVLAQLGFIFNCSGKPEQSIPILKRAIRLNPIPPAFYFTHLSIAYRLTGQYIEAIRMCKKAISIEPDDVTPFVSLASSYILLDRDKEAHVTTTEILKINPNFSLVEFAKKLPYKNQVELERTVDALRKAGLPD